MIHTVDILLSLYYIHSIYIIVPAEMHFSHESGHSSEVGWLLKCFCIHNVDLVTLEKETLLLDKQLSFFFSFI